MKYSIPHIRLQASTLVEVLVSMVILLSVFAIGMIIFTNLTKSSVSSDAKVIKMQMRELAQLYSLDPMPQDSYVIDSIEYFIEEQTLDNFTDRKLVTIYARRLDQEALIDSLRYIAEHDEIDQN